MLCSLLALYLLPSHLHLSPQLSVGTIGHYMNTSWSIFVNNISLLHGTLSKASHSEHREHTDTDTYYLLLDLNSVLSSSIIKISLCLLSCSHHKMCCSLFRYYNKGWSLHIFRHDTSYGDLTEMTHQNTYIIIFY